MMKEKPVLRELAEGGINLQWGGRCSQLQLFLCRQEPDPPFRDRYRFVEGAFTVDAEHQCGPLQGLQRRLGGLFGQVRE